MADTSTRFAISEPSADRSDAADVPLYVRNIVSAIESLGAIYGKGLIAARPAAGVIGRFYWSTDEDILYFDDGAAWNSVGHVGAGSIGTTELADASVTTAKLAQYAALQQGLYAARPAAAAALNGTMYYATDQVALYVCIAAAWVRLGAQPGDIIWTAEDSVRTGYLLADGSNVSRTGLNAPLFANWSTKFGVGDGLTTFGLPDWRGRMFANKGTHTDVATIGNNDGTAVANRRPKHDHTLSGGIQGGGSTNAGGSNSADTSSAGGSPLSSLLGTLHVGPSGGSTDTPSYFVLNAQIKL